MDGLRDVVASEWGELSAMAAHATDPAWAPSSATNARTTQRLQLAATQGFYAGLLPAVYTRYRSVRPSGPKPIDNTPRPANPLITKDINERVDVEAHGVAYVELQLASWLVDQLDAHTVAAIAWQVLRRATGIAKRLAIYLAAHSGDFQAITRHTERFVVPLTAQLYEEFGITAARERDRRASLARAAQRIAQLDDSRYTFLTVERGPDG